MAANGQAQYDDMFFLSQDPEFQNRVMMCAVQQCVVIGQEDERSVPQHDKRQPYAASVENNPELFKAQFSISVATDIGVITDATVNGTVTITVDNAAAQAKLVTDLHILGAFQGQFNTFFS